MVSLTLSAFAFFSPQKAKALLRVCNQTEEMISLALGYEDKRLFVTEGWWSLARQTCQTVIAGDLGRERYFFYAIDKQGAEWGGEKALCIDVLKFTISGITDCEGHGFRSVGFKEIERNDLPSQIIQLTSDDAKQTE